MGVLLNLNIKNLRTGTYSNPTTVMKSIGGGSSSSHNSADQSIVNNSNTASSFSPNSTTTDDKKDVGSSLTQEELDEIEKLTDYNNLPYREDPTGVKSKRKDDLYHTPNEELHNYWALNEKVYLYTFPDKKKHEYLLSFELDYDKDDILGTCQVVFPYDSRLMDYWIPGSNAFALIGGTFDREILFMGRVGQINQVGDTIEMIGHNLGWVFKQYMTSEFESKLEGQSVKNAVKLIFKELGIMRYKLDLTGIPNIKDYKIGENMTIEKDGETIESVPDLETMIENIKNNDIQRYSSVSLGIKETQLSADEYEKSLVPLDSVYESEAAYRPSPQRLSYGLRTYYNPTTKQIEYSFSDNSYKETDSGLDYTLKDPYKDMTKSTIAEKLEKSNDLTGVAKYFTRGFSGDGENTYEDVLRQIASAIDAQFFIVDDIVNFVSFNTLFTDLNSWDYKTNKLNNNSKSNVLKSYGVPTIEMWQLQHDSFKEDISQYGMYNTVEVEYANGTVKAAYDDLVRVYGEIKVIYKEKDLSYDAAVLKANAYLSAHVRDFSMEVSASVLHTGKLYAGSFIKIKNPLTMSDNFLFINGLTTSWYAGESTMVSDLDLRYGPENPDDPEVPEVGTEGFTSESTDGITYTGEITGDVAQMAKRLTAGCKTKDQKAAAIYNFVAFTIKYPPDVYYGAHQDVSSTITRKVGNCVEQSNVMDALCSAAGVKCEHWGGVWTSAVTGRSWDHEWSKVEYHGQMVMADAGILNPAPLGQENGHHSGHVMHKNY